MSHDQAPYESTDTTLSLGSFVGPVNLLHSTCYVSFVRTNKLGIQRVQAYSLTFRVRVTTPRSMDEMERLRCRCVDFNGCEGSLRRHA